MKSILVKTIPHETHRYNSVGDYFESKDGNKIFEISDMGNEDYELCVLIHELIEERLTRKKGITEEQITRFDELFEIERDMGLHKKEDEPGFDSRAPYRNEHSKGTKVEKLCAKILSVDWNKYDQTVNNL